MVGFEKALDLAKDEAIGRKSYIDYSLLKHSITSMSTRRQQISQWRKISPRPSPSISTSRGRTRSHGNSDDLIESGLVSSSLKSHHSHHSQNVGLTNKYGSVNDLGNISFDPSPPQPSSTCLPDEDSTLYKSKQNKSSSALSLSPAKRPKGIKGGYEDEGGREDGSKTVDWMMPGGIKVIEESEFLSLLNSEVVKVGCVYNEEVGRMAGMWREGRREEVGERIEGMATYLGVNLTGVRKILKKYDKVINYGVDEGKLTGRYLRMRGVGGDALACVCRADGLRMMAGMYKEEIGRGVKLSQSDDGSKREILKGIERKLSRLSLWVETNAPHFGDHVNSDANGILNSLIAQGGGGGVRQRGTVR